MIQGIDKNTTSLANVSSENKQKTTITPFEKVLEEAVKPEKPEVIVTSAKDGLTTSGSTKLDTIFKEASEKYGVPYQFLIAVAKAESNFNEKATSRSGAMGIMQLMPATAKSLGVKNAYDARQNIMGGAKYLAAHLKTFHGDTKLAAAAYNAGGSAVKKYNGIPPYEETQNYVKIVHRYMNKEITVPDKAVQASSESTETQKTTNVENTTPATEEDFSNSTVIVGTGDNAVTMTYGAYLRYIELGSGGVG